MRKWMRERIKRGGKKPSENLSESTGKIGQAIDPTKPSPLVPSYDSAPSAPAESRPRQQQADSAETTETPVAPASAPTRRHAQPSRRFSRQRGQRPQRQGPSPAQRETSDRELQDAESEEGLHDEGGAEAPWATQQPISEGEAAAKREPRGVVVLTIGLPG